MSTGKPNTLNTKQENEMDDLMLKAAQELTDEQAGGHGGRWELFNGGTDAVKHWIPTIVEKAEVLEVNTADEAGLEAVIEAGEPKGVLLIYTGQEKGLSMTGAVALIYIDPGEPGHKPANELWSAYPLFGDGVEVAGRVSRVLMNPNRLEGRLDIELDAGNTLFAFDPLFCLHRALYREGEVYRFSVAALAYAMEPAQHLKHVIDDPDEIRRLYARDDWAKKHGSSTKEDEAAALAAWAPETPEDMEPIRIDMSRMTMLMPSSEGPADDAVYMGEVVTVMPNAVQMLETSFWRVDVVLLQTDEDSTVTVPVYVAEGLFDGDWRPIVGEYVTGTLWLQAYVKRPVLH